MPVGKKNPIDAAYARLNAKVAANARRAFTLASEIAAKKVMEDLADESSLDEFLKTLGEPTAMEKNELAPRDLEEALFKRQYESVHGLAKAWDNTIPEHMSRVALQLGTLVGQSWFGPGHTAPLVNVTENFGKFAKNHQEDIAIGIARSVTARYYFLDTLRYVLNTGYDNAKVMPKAEAPAILRLAA